MHSRREGVVVGPAAESAETGFGIFASARDLAL